MNYYSFHIIIWINNTEIESRYVASLLNLAYKTCQIADFRNEFDLRTYLDPCQMCDIVQYYTPNVKSPIGRGVIT